MPRPAGSEIDHFRVLAHIADGSQAELYRAEDLRTGAEVALRVPHARVLANPALAARWRRECTVMAGLEHPGVVRRLDGARPGVEPYLALEYVGGGSLADWTGAGPRASVDQIVAWGREIAEALAYLHSRGVAHRDLKPANVLLTGDRHVKLADFGAAARTSRRRWWRLPEPPEGTPEYLSPEQVLGNPGDERSDLYGWGVVIYELLTGLVPFTGATPLAALEAHLTGRAVPPRALRPDTPAGLDAVIRRALRRSPEERHPDAGALLRDLDHLDAIDHAAVDLSPEPPLRGTVGGAAGRAAARFALVVAGGFAGLVALVIAASVLVH